MLEKCLKVNPKHSWAACDLAVIVHTVEKDSDKAEKMLRDVIQFDPKCANAYCNRRFQILHFILRLTLRSLDPATPSASLAHVCRPIREFLPLSPRFFVTAFLGFFARGPMLLVYGFGWWRGICL
jgi:hypothetical protein